MLQGLNFGQKLCFFFTMKSIEIRKSFMAYRPPPPHDFANKSFCLYMCPHILHNIWKWRVGTKEGRIVYDPKTSDRADKNAESVK